MEESLTIKTIESAYKSVRDNIAIEALYGVVVAVVAFTFISRMISVYRQVQQNDDGAPTMKDFMELVYQFILLLVSVSLFPILLRVLEFVFGEVMTAMQEKLGSGDSYNITDMFTKLIDADMNKTFGGSITDNAIGAFGMVINGDWFDMLCTMLAGMILYPLYWYSTALFIAGRYMYLLLLEMISPVAIACWYNENTRSYFFQWIKNLLISYLLIPGFILASTFSDLIMVQFIQNVNVSLILLVIFSLALKYSLLKIVSNKIHNLF